MRRFVSCAAIASAIFGASVASAGEAMIHVGHNKLDPSHVHIAVGDTVSFHNLDQMPGGHTVVATDGSLSSPSLEKGASWSHTFAAPGTFVFRIKEHPDATATVVVQ